MAGAILQRIKHPNKARGLHHQHPAAHVGKPASAWPALARWPGWSRSTLPGRHNRWMCPAPGDPEALPVEFLAGADPLPLLDVPVYLIHWPSPWCSPATAGTPGNPENRGSAADMRELLQEPKALAVHNPM